jgi:hypothetical protein
LKGAAQIAVPALVSTLCICIVFLPMFLLDGVARYLFVPLAEGSSFRHVGVLHSIPNPGTNFGDVSAEDQKPRI